MGTDTPGGMISVVVPYRPDGGHRDRAWDWLERRWRQIGDVELIVSIADPGAHPGEFNHPKAINQGVERASHDVLLIADADTAFDPGWVRAAADMIERGAAAWVLPLRYEKLTGPSTERVLAGEPGDPIAGYDTEWVGEGINWSGLVVVPRAGFDAAGGYDDRFEWWGADDVCFGLTMDALWGSHTRLDGSALHLWHPTPAEHNYGHERHPVQDQLMRRYTAAAGNPDLIRDVRFAVGAAA